MNVIALCTMDSENICLFSRTIKKISFLQSSDFIDEMTGRYKRSLNSTYALVNFYQLYRNIRKVNVVLYLYFCEWCECLCLC